MLLLLRYVTIGKIRSEESQELSVCEELRKFLHMRGFSTGIRAHLTLECVLGSMNDLSSHQTQCRNGMLPFLDGLSSTKGRYEHADFVDCWGTS
jgi:hypothetical protein